jgi:hypothetical protein
MLSSRFFVLPYHIGGFSGFCSRLPHWTLAVAAALAAECDIEPKLREILLTVLY